MYAPQPPAPLDGIGNDTTDVRYLFSYNLQRLASVSAQIAARATLHDFELTVQEWRALAILDFLGSAPMNLLAQRSGIQKSQVSRLIANLEQRNFICRRAHVQDKRISLLSLTPHGRDIANELLSLSRKRNEHMLEALDQTEREALMALIGKVTKSSLAYLKELKGIPLELEHPKPEPASFFEADAP
jgi:DNA-binding MarR family transcriptional regulator